MREITWFAALGALLVSILVSFSYPSIVLKLGEGPNVSLLSAFLGAAVTLTTESLVQYKGMKGG
ncbi:MAG: hypothetical protein KatS3mg060_0300 [Dehalococcoidia bacterium]|nr:MAG: hypothetical protein KatS3mg060_0300 [Dehalococcoidia bacterium]